MDFKYMEEQGIIDSNYARFMRDFEEEFKKERAKFDSDEDYLEYINNEFRKSLTPEQMFSSTMLLGDTIPFKEYCKMTNEELEKDSNLMNI